MISSENNRVSLDELYRQNWEHTRHVENERMNFTAIYVIIIAGVLAFLSQSGEDISEGFKVGILSFLAVLSAVGFLISLRLKADMEAHVKKIKELTHGQKNFVTFGAETGWTTKVKLRVLFPVFYSIGFTVFTIFAILS
jgi:hypothetical protein